MNSAVSAKIGVFLEGEAQDALTLTLSLAGYEVHVAPGINQARSMAESNRMDAWIFDARDDRLVDTLVATGKFVLPADNPPNPQDSRHFYDWSTALLQQIDSAVGCPFPSPVRTGSPRLWQQVRGVWLLAGSAGATPAVQQFLNTFREPPPVAFLYAQHYDPQKQYQLEQFTPENPAFSLHIGQGRHTMAPGQIIMIPPAYRVTMGPFGQLSSTRASWGNSHTPDFDELLVILTAARLPSPGVIIFSGMGSDGARALEVLDAGGGRIWAQSPDSAACDGMPRAAINTGLVQRSGDPATLARALESLYKLDG